MKGRFTDMKKKEIKLKYKIELGLVGIENDAQFNE